jgi:lysophospholipase L1-like esterase
VPVADGAGFNVQKTTVTGLSAGDHTVEVTYNGDGVKPLILLGASAENAQGVVVNNFSQYGQYTSTYGDITNLNPASWSGGSNYPADLVIYSLGLNNAAANFTADNFSKEVRKFFDAVRNGTATKPATGNTDILIVVQHAGTYDTNNVYQDYAVRRRGIAETYGAAIIDLWADGRNSWNYWNSLGYWSSGTTPGASGTDAVHLSDAGMQHVYDVVGPYVTATS